MHITQVTEILAALSALLTAGATEAALNRTETALAEARRQEKDYEAWLEASCAKEEQTLQGLW
jgi:hypothetical protein